MAVVETRVSVWEALAGRAPGQPTGPADAGLWSAVVERLNPARARPRLRPGIERAELVSVRGVPYVMLRSPDDGGRACYLRLTPEEVRLAGLMDGTRTVARLVAEFARICGRLAPDQVTRVVADLAGNRMLEELPVDVFRPLDRVARRPWPVRWGRALLAAVQGRRMVLANVDPLVTALYRYGGRLLFHRAAGVLLGLLALVGLVLFTLTWSRGAESVFLTGGSYVTGAAVLLGLNIVALACHELGHALATKHAGRRVPAAGFLVYFGIPSVFVDTTDVWMAGRRARLLATAAGPASGLVLAGAAQVVALAVPAAGPWAFKLAFAWYLNALFNLNPFLALDGYYLLMDWLEIPNLRARGLAWVGARLRRRPPSWPQLDREGRLVALYGMLALAWLVIAVNLGWRIWTDRVAGLTLGLWRSGFLARVLLLLVVAALAAPAVYALAGWASRSWRRARSRYAERRHEADAPRRAAALRAGQLAALSPEALAALAARATWVRPGPGTQLIAAGSAHPSVYQVVDGAVHARHPGDPSGTIRERVGPGGLIGLAGALTGAPAALTWHTAGTTLLAMPAAAVTAAIGPLPGPPPAERAEAEQLLAEAPALRGLSDEERLGLVARAQPVLLAPGEPVYLEGAQEAVVVSSGELTVDGGTPLRRGSLIGPAGERLTVPVATARTPVRLWRLPVVAGAGGLLGALASARPGGGPPVRPGAGPGAAPAVGVHPPADYPPLAAPPGPPPAAVDERVDGRFERALWWLLLLLLLFGLLLTGTNLVPGPAWAEMPADRALLSAERGRVDASVDGRAVRLERGERVYVAAGDRIQVADRSTARLVFRGGAAALLCAGSRADVGRLWTAQARPARPYGELSLVRGRLLADTAATSAAFGPLEVRVDSASRVFANAGAAWFAVTGEDGEVSSGRVSRDGVALDPTGNELGCGDGVAVRPPAGTPEPTPSVGPLPEPSDLPSPSPSVPPTGAPTFPPPGVTATPPPGATGPPTPPATTGPPTLPPTSPPATGRPTAPPTTVRPTTVGPTRTAGPTTSPSPTNRPPVIGTPNVYPEWMDPAPTEALPCRGTSDGDATTGYVSVPVRDPDPPHTASTLTVTGSWSINGGGGTFRLSPDGNTFYGSFQVPADQRWFRGGTVTVTIHAYDPLQAAARPVTTTVQLHPCYIPTDS